MKCSLLVSLCVAFLLLGSIWIAAGIAQGTSDEPAGASQEIDELVRQLGDDDFATRETATRKLMTREDAIPAIRKALRSPDQETARRAAKILEALNHKEDKRALARLQELGRNGEADQAAELLVRRQKWDDEEAAWQVMTGLAGRVIDLAWNEFGTIGRVARDDMPAGDFRKWVRDTRAEILTTGRIGPDLKKGRHGGFVVRADEISVMGDIGFNLLVAPGSVRGPAPKQGDVGSEIARSVIIAGGPVEFENITGSVVVCDGEVTARRGIRWSLIVARGDVRSSGYVQDSRIVTSGTVHFPDSTDATFDTKVKEKQATPLGFVKFFDPAKAGVAVARSEGGVRVTVAEEGKPFARAGLQAADVVVALDGRAVEGPEPFRRMLRTALAEGGTMTLKVRRAGQELEIRVPCPQ